MFQFGTDVSAFTIPSDALDANQTQQIVQQVISGMGDLGRNATVMSQTSEDGSSVNVHINLGLASEQSQAQQIINHAQNMVRLAEQVIERLEQSPDGQPVPPPRTENGNNNGQETGDTTQGASAWSSTESMDISPPAAEIRPQPPPEPTTTEEAAAPTTESGAPQPEGQTPQSCPTDHQPSAAAAAGIARATRAAAAAAVAAAAGVARAAAGMAAQGEGSAGTSGPNQAEGGRTAASRAPTTRVLAEVVSRIRQLQDTLQPHLERYLNLLNSESRFTNLDQRQRAQQTFNRVSEVFHYLSHAYHAVSELIVDMGQPVSRRHVDSLNLPLHQPGGLFQAGIPIQAQINVISNGVIGSGSTQAPGSTSAPASTTTSPRTTSPSQPRPTTEPSQPTTESQQQTPQPTNASSTPTTTPAEGVNLGAQVAGLLAAQNPILLMEVGPAGITIDSISATVVTEASSTTETSAAGTGGGGPNAQTMQFPGSNFAQPPPPEFLQQLLQTMGQRSGNNGQTQARGNTSTNTTTSTQTRSTARPVQNMPLAFPGFGMAFDPYLPCMSRHVYARSSVSSQPRQGSQSSAANGAPGQTTGGTETHQTPPMDGQFPPEIELSGIISNIMSAFLGGQPYLHATPVPGGGVSGTHRTIFNLQNQPPPPATNRPPSAGSNNQSAGGSQGPSTRREGEGEASAPPIPRNIFSDLIQGMVGAGTLNNNTTVADLMNSLGPDDEPESPAESFMNDLIMTITQGMTIRELVSTFLGHTEPLDRIRPRLQQFIREKLLHNREPTAENVNAAVEEVITIWHNQLIEAGNEANVKEDVDYVATIENYERQRLQGLINLILNESQENFGRTLYTTCQTIVNEFIALHLACFVDGQQSLERVAQGRIRALSSNSNQVFDLITLCAVNIRAVMSNLTVSQDAIAHYIVRKAAPAEAGHPGGDSAVPARTEPVSQSAASSKPEPMETEPIEKPVEMNTATCSPELVVNDAEAMVVSPASWHDAVPSEWVPIINRDVQRQRRLAPQAPFSDAYIEGMPSKRRKMMASGKLPSCSEAQLNLNDSLERAISGAGVQPATSVQDLSRSVLENPNLQSSFSEHVRDAIRQRLQSDPDYNPRRFPNADKYYFPGKEK